MDSTKPAADAVGGAAANPRLFIDGAWVEGAGKADVLDKFDGSVVAHLAQASREQVARAVAGVQAAFERGAPPAPQRAAALTRAAALLEERAERFVATMAAEAGFTRSEAMGEVTRGVQTLLASADEGKRLKGEMIPFSGVPGQQNRLAFTIRKPLGVICAITPFNSPLNTVLHKVAPAIASGNGLVLKPASATPLTAALIVEMLLDAGVDRDFIALVHGPGGQLGKWLSEEEAISFFAFTGSTAVGKTIHAAAGLRRTQMELGSIAATILNHDADLGLAMPKVLNAGYRKAGQVCTSVQRLYVHDSLYDDVEARMTAAVGALRAGNPRDAGTDVGPLISEGEARRIEAWIAEAVASGARLLAGGERRGTVVTPALLADATTDMKVMSQEVFGPLVVLRRFSSLDAAIDEINATPYGLATGIFTRDIEAGMHAAMQLRVGGVHINETCSSRVDIMPYGGCKDSGFGREGPRYAIEEMTEERLITISLNGLGAAG